MNQPSACPRVYSLSLSLHWVIYIFLRYSKTLKIFVCLDTSPLLGNYCILNAFSQSLCFHFPTPAFQSLRFIFSMKLNLSQLVLDTSTGMQRKQQSHSHSTDEQAFPAKFRAVPSLRPSRPPTPKLLRGTERALGSGVRPLSWRPVTRSSLPRRVAHLGLPNQCLRPAPPTPGITGPYNTRGPEWNAWHRAVQ